MKIAIIGGGVAGSSAAIYLANLGLDVTLFEKKESLVDGPPMCHLHAGGNLYREISDNQCIQLLKESIELLRLYPKAIDFRPTIIAIPIFDKSNPHDLLQRLELLKKEYQKLINEDEKNKLMKFMQCDIYETMYIPNYLAETDFIIIFLRKEF